MPTIYNMVPYSCVCTEMSIGKVNRNKFEHLHLVDRSDSNLMQLEWPVVKAIQVKKNILNILTLCSSNLNGIWLCLGNGC